MRALPPPMAALAVAAVALTLDAALVLAVGWRHLAATWTLPGILRAAATPEVWAAHLLLLLPLLAGLWRWRAELATAPAVGLLIVLVLFLGPIGAVVGFLAAFVSVCIPASRRAGLVAAPAPAPRPRTSAMTAPGHDSDDRAQSLCDIFRHGTLAQRRRAVALIAGNFKPQFAPALQMALRDANNAIRVQAGMALLQLEDEIGKEHLRLEGLGDAQLAAFGFDRHRTHLDIARLHDSTAYSGLLDVGRRQTAQFNAVQAYQQHLALHPDDEEAIAAVGRLFVRAGQHQLVADWFGQLVAAGPVNDSVLTWLAEALFLSGRYEALRGLVQQFGARLARRLPADSPLHGVLALWRGGTAP